PAAHKIAASSLSSPASPSASSRPSPASPAKTPRPHSKASPARKLSQFLQDRQPSRYPRLSPLPHPTTRRALRTLPNNHTPQFTRTTQWAGILAGPSRSQAPSAPAFLPAVLMGSQCVTAVTDALPCPCYVI